MQRHFLKATISVLWISAVCAAGTAGHLQSLADWTVLTGIALVPSMILMSRWNDPEPTMSERIRKALR